MPWVRPTEVVVLPSPAGVGVMPVTTTSFPWLPVPSFQGVQGDFGLGVAVGDQVFGGDAQSFQQFE